MHWIKQAKQVVFVLEDHFEPERGYRVYTAVDGVQGFVALDLYYGMDYDAAVWYANQKNTLMGVNVATASRIIANATKDKGTLNYLPI